MLLTLNNWVVLLSFQVWLTTSSMRLAQIEHESLIQVINQLYPFKLQSQQKLSDFAICWNISEATWLKSADLHQRGAVRSRSILFDSSLSFVSNVSKYMQQTTSAEDIFRITLSLIYVIYVFARLFIAALPSPAGKGLNSWLLFAMSNCDIVTFTCSILGQVWYLIVLIPDLGLSYFKVDFHCLLLTFSISLAPDLTGQHVGLNLNSNCLNSDGIPKSFFWKCSTVSADGKTTFK